MQNFYDVTIEQKNFFIEEVWELAGEQSFTPTFIEVLEDTDKEIYVIAFLKQDAGGVHYVIGEDYIYSNNYTRDEANQVILNNEITKGLGMKSKILPQNKFMEIKRVINNL